MFEYKAIKIIKVAPKKRCRIVIYESREYSCVNKRVYTQYWIPCTIRFRVPLLLSKYKGRRIHSFQIFSIGPIYVLYLAFFKSRYNNCNNDQREKKSATCIITTNWFFLDLQGLQGVLNKGELKYVFLYLSYLHDNFCLIFGPYFSYSK